MKKFIFFFLPLLLISCKKGTQHTTNNLNISDKYYCVEGCASLCVFDNEITVQNIGENLIISSVNGEGVGVLLDTGDFFFQDDFCTCEGEYNKFIGGFTATCTCDATICQTVKYFSKNAYEACLADDQCCNALPKLCLYNPM